MSSPVLGPFSWERVIRAVEAVRERMLRATAALEAANVPYAVVGGNAIAHWVARVDRAAVRNTRDVDILVRRADFDRVKGALSNAGFVYHEVIDVHAFLDGPDGSIREAVHLLFAGEKVYPNDDVPTPDVAQSEPADSFRVLQLDALVLMKLTSFRDKDRTHLRDLLELNLVDASWLNRLPQPLAARLQQLLDTPGG